MSSELYSRTFSDPRCSVRTDKEGTLLLPPRAHKYAKRLGGGQAFQGEIQGSPFQDVKGKHELCSQIPGFESWLRLLPAV